MSNALAASPALGSSGVPTDSVAFPAGTSTAPSAPVLTPSFAANTAAQLSDTTRDYMVYLQIGTAGTALAVTMGPTSAANAATVITGATATAGEIIAVRLPAGWFLKWNATTATVANQVAVGC